MASGAIPLPIPVLLSRVLGHLTAEVEVAAGVGPSMPSLAVWSNVVRCVAEAGPDGLTERTLPIPARISRRLATAAVTGCARRGWLEATARAGSKDRALQLTDAGAAAADVWPKHLASLDAEWRDTALRTALEELVSRFELELPHHPASYGAADPSAIGAPFVHKAPEPADGLPRHGTDWSPVRRSGDRQSLAMLPITALLSQALMGFTIDYENRFPWPLASTLSVLCHVGPEPRPLDDVPGDHGITGGGKSLLERHLIVQVTKEGRQKVVALTDRGKQVLHHHPGRLETVEGEWRDRFGTDLVRELRAELDTIVASKDLTGPDFVLAPIHLG